MKSGKLQSVVKNSFWFIRIASIANWKRLCNCFWSRFNPSRQISPTQSLAHPPISPLSGIGERTGRVKVQKLMGWEKDSWKGKAKAAYSNKAKQGIHSLLPSGRQLFSDLQESRAPSHVIVVWEDRHCNSELSPFLLPLWLFGASCPCCVSSQLCSPSLLASRVVWEAEKALMLCKHCSVITKKTQCYQRFHRKAKT